MFLCIDSICTDYVYMVLLFILSITGTSIFFGRSKLLCYFFKHILKATRQISVLMSGFM